MIRTAVLAVALYLGVRDGLHRLGCTIAGVR